MRYLYGGGLDLCVVAHFQRIIKKELLSIPRLGFINLHPSKLPYYRGMSPQHWPIINRETSTAITVHYIDETADTGDIIIQETVPIDENDYVADLQKKWMAYYKTIVIKAIDKILNGKPTTKQSHLRGSYYGKLTKDECRISLASTVKEAYALIRAVSMPYYGAWIDDTIIWKAHVAEANICEQISDLSMDLHTTDGFGLVLMLKDGLLLIDKYSKNERTNN